VSAYRYIIVLCLRNIQVRIAYFPEAQLSNLVHCDISLFCERELPSCLYGNLGYGAICTCTCTGTMPCLTSLTHSLSAHSSIYPSICPSIYPSTRLSNRYQKTRNPKNLGIPLSVRPMALLPFVSSGVLGYLRLCVSTTTNPCAGGQVSNNPEFN